ncbi:MAG TPA: heat-shock protein, partial [Stellaceae bacterium]|nr:heat-shock protein [Stellaceae bacterium]
EGIEVAGAWLDNGLLHIDLVRPSLESRVRTIEIRQTATDGQRKVDVAAGGTRR